MGMRGENTQEFDESSVKNEASLALLIINITLDGAHHQEDNAPSGDTLFLPVLAMGMKKFCKQFPSQISLISNRKQNWVDQYNVQVNYISFYRELNLSVLQISAKNLSLQALL